jgi:hypothetical protein
MLQHSLQNTSINSESEEVVYATESTRCRNLATSNRFLTMNTKEIGISCSAQDDCCRLDRSVAELACSRIPSICRPFLDSGRFLGTAFTILILHCLFQTKIVNGRQNRMLGLRC